MPDQPGVPDDYDRFFRDPKPQPQDQAAAYDKFFRNEPPAPAEQPAKGNAGRANASTVAPPPTQAPTRLPKPKRKKPLWRRILRWLMLILAVILVYVLGLLVYLMSNISKVDISDADQIGNTPGSVTLLVGSDEREDDPSMGSRTDTIMLMVDPTWGPPTLISIPRDSWVAIPGHGEGKINSSYSIGGPSLLLETVEQSTGLHVDHYVEVGFTGIVELTDGASLTANIALVRHNARLGAAVASSYGAG